MGGGDTVIFPRRYIKKEQDLILSKLTIISDTREQKNRHLLEVFENANISYIKEKLDFADYSFYVPPIPELDIQEPIYFNNYISIEKKNSIDELASNIAERERLKKEFQRHKGLMILLIETDTYGDIFEHKYKSKLSPQSFIGTLHAWSVQYKIPFIFIPKSYTAKYIYFTFYYYLRHVLKEGV